MITSVFSFLLFQPNNNCTMFLSNIKKWQPASLYSMSTKVAIQMCQGSKKNIESLVNDIPVHVQLKVCTKLFAFDLFEYVRQHKGIANIKSQMNDNDFQIFLFHFMKEAENNKLNFVCESAFNAAYETFKLVLEKEVEVDKENPNKIVNVTKFDKITRYLGFDSPILPQELPEKTHEQRCYQIKFETFPGNERFPIPSVTPLLENIIPTCRNQDDENLHEELFYGPKQRWPYVEPVNDPDNVVEKFHFRLGCIFECLKNGAHHEVLAFASELLSDKIYQAERELNRSFLHVWGALSVSMAHLNRDFSLVLSSLSKMDEFASLHSEKLDSYFYQQQACSALFWMQKEERMFEQIHALVPRSSLFFNQSLLIHLKTKIQHVENLFFQLVRASLNRDYTLESNLQLTIKRNIFEMKQNLHSVYARQTFTEIDLNRSLHHQFAILEVYNFMLDCFHNTFVTDAVRDRQITTACNLLIDSNHHIDIFLRHYVFGHNIGQYRVNLTNHKEELEAAAKSKNIIEYADVLFAHSLFLKFLDRNHFAPVLADEAQAIYKKFDHPRWKLIEDCKPVSRVRNSFDANAVPTGILYTNIEIVSLLRADSALPKLVRSGIDSIKRFDSLELY